MKSRETRCIRLPTPRFDRFRMVARAGRPRNRKELELKNVTLELNENEALNRRCLLPRHHRHDSSQPNCPK